jgi:cytidine deaminase
VIEAASRGDAAVARRMAALAELVERAGPGVVADVERIVATPSRDPLGGSTIGGDIAAELVARHGLGSSSELALLALPVAMAMARPPISGYRVAAVGVEAEGDLVLGANLEFPGADLGATIHAEGFVALRARRRARRLASLAVREAHPCAHCRQTLAEAADADALAIVDLLGNELSLEDLYPWSFRPAALEHDGDAPGATPWPALSLATTSAPLDATVPADVAAELLAAGSRAHATYSGAPSAVVLRLADGRLRSAGCVESVAFNPSVTAMQAALVEVDAARADAAEITDAWLGRTEGGSVDPEAGFRALLRAVAPDAKATVVDWRTGD